MTAPLLILLDNGSLEPAATRSLRRIAAALSVELGQMVHPVSLLHSHKVPAEQLDGTAAPILVPFLRRRIAEGQREFCIIPLFFGPSGALVDYVPEKIAELQAEHPTLKVLIAPPLVDPHELDDRLLQILEDNIRTAMPDCPVPPKVVLVDHGSPKREVTEVRNVLAHALATRLGPSANGVRPASMERRPEAEYDFNEPLLETLLADKSFAKGLIVVGLLFLSPGRHAGPGGDISRICDEAKRRNPCLQILLSPLVGEHPELPALLATRARSVLSPLVSA